MEADGGSVETLEGADVVQDQQLRAGGWGPLVTQESDDNVCPTLHRALCLPVPIPASQCYFRLLMFALSQYLQILCC